MLYGMPLPSGAVAGLTAVALGLGDGGLSVLLDDPAQLETAARIKAASGLAPHAYIKIDMGGQIGRAHV